jgi:hypothetical protein
LEKYSPTVAFRMHDKIEPPTYRPAEMAHSGASQPLHASYLCPVRIIFAVAPCKPQGQNVAMAQVAQSHLPGAPQSHNPLVQLPDPMGTTGCCAAGGPPA